MPGSGQLALEIATALDVPHSSITTVVKALRAARLLPIKGRGSSAAQMDETDAIRILVGLMCGGVSADIPKLTERALQIPLRHFVRTQSEPRLGDLASPYQHTFLEGLQDLFKDEWDPQSARQAAISDTSQRPDTWVTFGVTGQRSEFFATIEIRDPLTGISKNFYSSLPVRENALANDDPGGLGLTLYRKNPPFVFCAAVSGQALRLIKRALSSPP